MSISVSLDHTHNPDARAWLKSANSPDTEFPVQNLPFCTFSHEPNARDTGIGVAIGDQLVDMRELLRRGELAHLPDVLKEALATPDLTDLMSLGTDAARMIRHALFDLLVDDAPARSACETTLVPQAAAHLQLPARIGAYTDFYASRHHALNCGRLFRPDQPLFPNYDHLPIAYNGRASSVVVSGAEIPRPPGQYLLPGETSPVFGPSRKMDYEFELGFFVGKATGSQGIALAESESHIFGMSILNDWSARDIQAWEGKPLGPFQSKNFRTSISPFVVTLDALAPFRTAHTARPNSDPPLLPYLQSVGNMTHGALDITVETWIRTAGMRNEARPPALIASANFREMYWTIFQMLVQSTVNGCGANPGDLLASGTISGSSPGSQGCLLELTKNGNAPLTLEHGESRRFLEDGDEVILNAYCERPGFRRIGFGSCRGLVM
jgi:fumarylacetoacetase